MFDERVPGRVAKGAIAAQIAGLLVLGLFAAGCRAKGTEADFSGGAVHGESVELSAKKVAAAGVAIASACAKRPYANARKGLIVSEAGLHEDVFELRSRSSYRAVAYGMGETQMLEALLQKEAGAGGRSNYPADQEACIRQFTEHMQTLTDRLAEQDAVQKQLDISAFDSASKEAQQEMEQEEKAIAKPGADGQP